MNVILEYDGYDPKLDTKLENAAEKLGGKLLGAGVFLPTSTRDIQFSFPSKAKAKAFLAFLVKNHKKIRAEIS